MLRRCRDMSLHRAGMNVVLGERMRDRLLSLGVAENKIAVIENWAECNPPIPKRSLHSVLRTRNKLADKFVVGYSGNLGRAHEFQTLLGAAEMLKNDETIVFLMIGGGAGMTQLLQAAKQRSLPNFVFLPYQAREVLSDSLAAADVHWVSLLPHLEGCIVPSKFYGILAAARPVIFVGDTDGELARAIRAGECGFAVAMSDVDALVGAVRTLQGDASQRDRLGGNAYHRYCQHYSARRAFERWLEIVRPAIPLSGAPTR
jgi:glycosyltransferase involved in cell wall biosynthesis